MNWLRGPAAAGLLLCAGWSCALAQAPAPGDVKRGEYVAKAGGCVGCHTQSKGRAVAFAGGRALATPFGIFFGPNITPHPAAGLGKWTEAEFFNAMRHGVRPDGAHYYPAFPYASFTRITDVDLKDLWAYLRSIPPDATPSKPHELRFPFGYRFLLWGWKWLFFEPSAFAPEPARSATINRGAYLTQALGHCGECHTPRNLLGGWKKDRYLGGAKLPDGVAASNLTPTRLKKLDDQELKEFLKFGQTPDGDVVGETMGEVIRNTTSQLTNADLDALVAYLRTVPPLPEEPKSKSKQ